jgi:Fic family protein
MNRAVSELDRLPLSNRLLKDTHAVLMQSVRGELKSPGEFRRSQNWIGASLKDAAYIPPHDREVFELMGDLESFWHNDRIEVPHLIRIAISHYQFETIHPFLDGNGRIGRLLIPLYLISKGLLAKPSLYLSSYLEKFKGAYFDSLTRVRASSDLGQWVRFFLVAVAETAQSGKATFQRVLQLRTDTESAILGLGRRAENAKKLLAMLYRRPFTSVNEVASRLDVSPQTANQLVKAFEKLGILQEVTGFQRNRFYVFYEYSQLFG